MQLVRLQDLSSRNCARISNGVIISFHFNLCINNVIYPVHEKLNCKTQCHMVVYTTAGRSYHFIYWC